MGMEGFWGRVGGTQKRKMEVEVWFMMRGERKLVCEVREERERGKRSMTVGVSNEDVGVCLKWRSKVRMDMEAWECE